MNIKPSSGSRWGKTNSTGSATRDHGAVAFHMTEHQKELVQVWDRLDLKVTDFLFFSSSNGWITDYLFDKMAIGEMRVRHLYAPPSMYCFNDNLVKSENRDIPAKLKCIETAQEMMSLSNVNRSLFIVRQSFVLRHRHFTAFFVSLVDSVLLFRRSWLRVSLASRSLSYRRTYYRGSAETPQTCLM